MCYYLIKQLRMCASRLREKEGHLDHSLQGVAASRICAAAVYSCPACSQPPDVMSCLRVAQSCVGILICFTFAPSNMTLFSLCDRASVHGIAAHAMTP